MKRANARRFAHMPASINRGRSFWKRKDAAIAKETQDEKYFFSRKKIARAGKNNARTNAILYARITGIPRMLRNAMSSMPS